jgi:hypothetical protein
MLAPALAACLLCLTSRAEVKASVFGIRCSVLWSNTEYRIPNTQSPVQQPAESYRLRISNSLYGAVEVSADRGQTWTLIGRVQKAALTPSDGGVATLPMVERASKEGLAFAIGGRRLLRVLPDLPANYKNGSAIVINHARMEGLFKELLPAVGSEIQQIVGKREAPLPADFVPHDGDVFLITCKESLIPVEKLPEQVKLLGQKYQDSVLERLRKAGKKPTSGTLTVSVNVAPGDKPGALTYYLDGEVLAIQNQPPFVLKVDTKRWPNGEHVLEARAVDANGGILTQKKTLLYIENAP